jgi:hypothetical protein
MQTKEASYMTSRTMITNESWSCDAASPEWDLQHIAVPTHTLLSSWLPWNLDMKSRLPSAERLICEIIKNEITQHGEAK